MWYITSKEVRWQLNSRKSTRWSYLSSEALRTNHRLFLATVLHLDMKASQARLRREKEKLTNSNTLRIDLIKMLIQTQEVWGGAWETAFLAATTWCWCFCGPNVFEYQGSESFWLGTLDIDQPFYFADQERINDFLKITEWMSVLPKPYTVALIPQTYSATAHVPWTLPLCFPSFSPFTHCAPS